MQESLAGIYKEESSRIKGKPFYRQYRHRSPGEIYAASAQGAYGLLGDKAGSKAIENFSKDTKDNLIINRYWLTDNGKL